MDEEKQKLIDYLESIVGKRLFDKKDRDELCKMMNVKLDGELVKKTRNLNHCLIDIGINYFIGSGRDNLEFEYFSPNPNYRRLYWKVYRIIKVKPEPDDEEDTFKGYKKKSLSIILDDSNEHLMMNT